MLERSQPQNIEAEQSVLSAMIWNQDALGECLVTLKADDFYVPGNQVIFSALKNMFDDGRTIDLITLTDTLKSMGKLGFVGGPEYIIGLGDSYVQSGLQAQIAIIRRCAMLRDIIKAMAGISALAYNAPEDTKEIVDRAEQMLLDVTERSRTLESFEGLNTLMPSYLDFLGELRQNGIEQGIMTGFPELDNRILGMRPGQMVVVGARPGVGKTSFALNVAVNAAKAGASVAFFSLEMSKQEIAQRLLASETTGVHMSEFRSGNINPANWETIISAIDTLQNLDIVIDDTAGTTVTEIRAKARRILKGKEHGLVVVDYMQLLSPPATRRAENRATEVSEMSRSLKMLSKDLGVPVIALSQLNRQVESRGKTRDGSPHARRPQLADLRESGSIEQDADIVLLLDRALTKEEAADPSRPDWGTAECIIAKNRSGETGSITLAFRAEDTKFISLSGANWQRPAATIADAKAVQVQMPRADRPANGIVR